MIRRSTWLVPGALALLVPAETVHGAAPPGTPIRPEAIRAHMRFLSDGLLEGRAPDGRGYALAAAYVAAQMEAAGLAPGAGGGSYLQRIPMRKAVLDETATSLVLTRDGREERVALPDDFFPAADRLRLATAVEAPVVFAGFGVTAPGRDHDDYASIDARGKIVAAVWGAPPRFEPAERAHFSNNLVKQENAVAHGAVGFLSIMTPDDLRRYRWEWLLPQGRSGSLSWLDADGRPSDVLPALRGVARLNGTGAARLLAGAPQTPEAIYAAARAGRPPAFDLPVRARLEVASKHANFESVNVLGIIRGSDARLAGEAVVVTAHLDHLGLCPPVDGDAVCHGAYDNASGVATLLEIARVLAARRPAPRRSILFAAVTGEEKGLLGSDFLARHPVEGLEVVANVNIDGAPGILYPLVDVVALGVEHSTLRGPVEAAARASGYVLRPDPMPEETYFVRSDQYSFVRQGIPSVCITDGGTSAERGVDGLARARTWMVTLYHTPKDSMEQPFDFASAARAAGLNLGIVERVAATDARPAWNPGDFFGSRFGKESGAGTR